MAKRSMVAMKESVGFMNDDNLLEQRNQVKTQFQELENASEYCETHYFKNTNMRVPNLISANKFWDDFAHHILKEGKPHGFVSENFIYATNSTTELIMMLAVIDLPFDEPTHRIGIEGNKGIKVDTAGNMAVFKKEIKEAEADLDTNLLSIHRFYEYSNPNSKKKLKEFLTHQVYT